MNPTVQTVLKYTVIYGSVVVVAGAIGEIWKNGVTTKSIMPAITGLVGVSAFSYAIAGNEIRVIPKV